MKIIDYGEFGPMAPLKTFDTGLRLKIWFTVWTHPPPIADGETPENGGTLNVFGATIPIARYGTVSAINETDDRWHYMGKFSTGRKAIMLNLRPFSRVASVTLNVSIHRSDNGTALLTRRIPLEVPRPGEGPTRGKVGRLLRKTGIIEVGDLSLKFPFSLDKAAVPPPQPRRVFQVRAVRATS